MRRAASFLVALALLCDAVSAGGGKDLTIYERSSTRIRGVLIGDPPVAFDSKCVHAECVVTLQLGQTKRLVATKDLQTNEVRLRFTGHVLTEPEREVIGRLEPLLNTRNDPNRMPVEDILFSFLNMLSEAPVGQRLEDLDLKPPAAGQAK